ncbi:MAG: iron complex outermembrane receptor protein [Candidatus Azotimanducaceae bacterium]|jgi:iron complex outermembrane receptor protein
MHRTRINKSAWHIIAFAALALPASLHAAEEEVTDLEKFIVSETDAALEDTLLPTERQMSGIFGDTTNILQVPRAVSLISPQMLEEFNIDDLGDLKKVSSGTQTYNYYGIPGAPIIRGAKGGTFLNGMLRAYQRNEMPLSFGSLEAIELVKGPAPADFSPTQIGGFVNLLPKSPYYDESTGSVSLDVDQWGMQRVTGDVGAPFMLGDKPAAYRVSLTSQDGESYYDDVSNDFTSLYGSLKFQASDTVSVFVGGEFFDFKSNENAGWNRPTQQLIDDDRYVIGEPAAMVSPAWRGTLNRNGVEFPTAGGLNPALFAMGIPGEVARAQISGTNLANMLNMNSAADRAVVYDASGSNAFGGPLPQDLIDTLNANGATPQDLYIYTPAYFANGGEVLTTEIGGETVLADQQDFADSENLVLFGDVVFGGNPMRTYTLKFLYEELETEKRSSYGYAIDTEQTVFSAKGFMTDRETIPMTTTTLGVSIRYTDALILQDFFAEPFSRRDITSAKINPNTILLVGDESPIGGLNLWSGTAVGGANVESELTQSAVFVSFETQWTQRLTSIAAVRYELADFDIGLPGEAQRAAGNAAAVEAESGDTDYVSYSFGPSLEIMDGVYLYGSWQEGTSVDPTQGGAIFGEQNFADNEMWEAGFKAGLLDGKLYVSGAVYEWEQSTFNARAGQSEALEAEGFELEATWQISDSLTLISSYTDLETRRIDDLGFRSVPFSEQDWALYGGELTSNFSAGSFDGRVRDYGRPTNNPDLIYPGAPQKTFKFFGLYDFGNGFALRASAEWQEEFWLDFDRTKEVPDVWSFNVGARYKADNWELGVSIENLADEDIYLGADPVFAANTLLTKAPERTVLSSVTFNF